MATKMRSSLKNDLAHILPPLRTGESYYLVRPLDPERKYEPFITIGTSEGRVRELTIAHLGNGSDYTGEKLDVSFRNWADAKGYSAGWTAFRFLAERGDLGYLYLELDQLGEQFIALPYDNTPDWTLSELVRQSSGQFWIPEDRVHEYLELVTRRAEDDTH
jgi:hypothetical protein